MGKASRGRPRKSGNRTKSGQLSRAGKPARDKGTDRIAAQIERYGGHYCTAIGRAYAAGLLGEGQEAQDRYQAGKRFARLYTRLIAPSYRCPLNDTPQGGGTPDHERDQADQDWLFDMGDKLNRAGLRPWFDQLTGDQHHDTGPRWLDNLLDGKTHPGDVMVLEAAIAGLDLISPVRKPMGILAVAA
jgi:hypothetical protein